MPTYIGENKIIDRYLGDKFLEAAYIGDQKVYDPYTEITGYLPVIYKSRAAVALKNYRIYGTVDGAGVETENLFSAKLEQGTLGSTGETLDSDFRVRTSNFIILPSDSSLVLSSIAVSAQAIIFVYDLNGTYLRTLIGEWSTLPIAFTASANEKIKIVFRNSNNTSITPESLPTIMLTEGSTPPDHYIPPGYKLPLTVESGETENLWNLGTLDCNAGEFTINGYTVTMTGKSTASNYYFSTTFFPAGTYILDFDARSGCYFVVGTNAENANILIDNTVGSPLTRPSYIGCNYAFYRYSESMSITISSDSSFRIAFAPNITEYIVSDIMLVKGSTPPDHYIPHRYASDIPIYIGSSKLGEEEYVDFGEQKVYKYAEPLKIYGWHVDPSVSDPAQAVTYLADAIGKTPAAMGTSSFSYGDWSDAFFMPKPCMLRSDGTVAYYLDPNDYTKKADGTASDVANASFDGNAMMEWPLIWYKFEAGAADGEGYFYCSNKQADSSYKCWCNYDCDDNIIDHFYTAIYNGTGTSKMRSISGVTLTSANGNGGTTATQEITRATANNTTDKTEWYIDVWSDRMMINGLLILMGKSLNSQAVFGRGLDTGSQSAKEAYVTGSLNDKGLFWGNTSAGTSGVKVFGMENYWGCVWHRTAGLIGLSNGNTAYKLTYGTADGTTADGYNTNGNGYLVDTTARPANGYFKTAKFGKFGYLPLTTGGSSTTYYSDYWYTNNSALTFALVGGGAHKGVNDGCSYFSLNNAPGHAYWHISSSLSFKPLAKTVPEPDLTPTDPPVPLPHIPTYKGENTLSSTETLGEVTVKGRIKQPTYRQVEYLKSTGTQYIQTDIIPFNTTKIQLDMQFGDFHEYANASTYNSYFCGVAEFGGDTTSDAFWGVSLNELSGSTDFDFYLGNVSWQESANHISNPANITTRQTMQICRGSSYWGNQTALVNAAVTKAEPTEPLAIMGFNCVDRPDFSPNPYKCRNLIIYGVMIYLNGSELSHNLIPVERKDGELGLLDTITNKFYANAGTGTFEKGDYI